MEMSPGWERIEWELCRSHDGVDLGGIGEVLLMHQNCGVFGSAIIRTEPLQHATLDDGEIRSMLCCMVRAMPAT